MRSSCLWRGRALGRAPGRALASALLVLLVLLVAACGDDEQHCGAAQDGGDTATLVTAASEAFTYGEFTSSENNDCPGGGPVSVTVGGKQVGTGFPITLCLPRPDRIGGAAIALSDTTLVEVKDVSAQGAAGCTFEKDLTAGAPTGTITFEGFCTTVGAGYNITFAGAVPGTRTCPGDAGPPSETPVTLQLQGTVAVDVTAF